MEIYSTKDFGEAVALTCAGFEMLGLQESRRAGEWLFTFEDTDQLQIAIKKHYTDELLISTLSFCECQRRLRRELYIKLGK